MPLMLHSQLLLKDEAQLILTCGLEKSVFTTKHKAPGDNRAEKNPREKSLYRHKNNNVLINEANKSLCQMLVIKRKSGKSVCGYFTLFLLAAHMERSCS